MARSTNLYNGFPAEFGPIGKGSFAYDVTRSFAAVPLRPRYIDYSSAQPVFSGMGDFIRLDLNTSLESGLVARTYYFSRSHNAFIFVDGNVGTDYDLSTQAAEYSKVVGGYVEAQIIGNETYFSWNRTSSNRTKVASEF